MCRHLIQSICDGCCRRLINDTLTIEASNSACIKCGLPLRIIKVSRYGDDGLSDITSNLKLSHLLHCSKGFSSDLLWVKSQFYIILCSWKQDLWPIIATIDDLERPQPAILCNLWLRKPPPD